MSAASRLFVLSVLTGFTVFLLLPTSSNGSLQSIFKRSQPIDEILRLSQEHLPEITASLNVSKKCNYTVEGVLKTAAAALYLDALGKPPGAALLGNAAWLGSYSECTKIIPGAHYCLAYVYIPALSQIIPVPPVRWGICVPQACSEQDVTLALGNAFAVLNKYGNQYLNKTVAVLSPQPAYPGTDEKKPVYCAKPSEYTTGVILTLTLCGLILFLCLVGTVVDVIITFMKPRLESMSKSESFMPVRDDSLVTDSDRFPYFANDRSAFNESDRANLVHSYPAPTSLSSSSAQPSVCNPNVAVQFFLCFSLIQNTNRIMDTKVPPGAITSINGMRVLSMWWVILGHTYIFQFFSSVSNTFLFPQIISRFTFQTIDNATFSVDSFFFLSGLLVSYLSLRQMEKKNGLPIFKFYFHRFWRLTPTYMFVVLFYTKLTGFLGEGPMWYTQQQNPACDNYWWTNLLYINNFYPTSMGASCMGWAWYLANDMQFYVISPIILYAAYRFGLPGLLATIGTLLSASFIATGIIMHVFELDAASFGEGAQVANAKHDPQSLVYVKPYCRIAPYLVGMLLGYVFHKPSRRIPMVYIFNVIGWCVAIVLALSTLYGEYKVLRKDDPKPFNEAENISYGTFSRFAWSLALAWVIYACHRGLGGLVNSILSARFWIPLSRLTYSVYLVHIIAITMFFTSLETAWAFSDVHVSFCFAGMVAVSYAAAFIVSVCVEFPMMQLEKLIFKTNR